MKMKLMLIGGAVIMFFIAASLNAQAPQVLNYQGKITNNNDGTAAAGDFVMIFSIYSTKLGGTALWTETQNVTVTKGVFNVLLGSVTPLVNRLTNKGLFAEAGERYLGIKVGADPEMMPRFQLTSVAYAIKSSQADKATTADTARVAQMAYSLNATTGAQTNAVFVAQNGNVGIGTANPNTKLSINGGNATDTRIRINNTANSGGMLIGQDSGTNFSIFNTEKGYLRLGAGNVERMRINEGAIQLAPTDNVVEGSEVQWAGAGNSYNWVTDVFSNLFRINAGSLNEDNQVQIFNDNPSRVAGLYVEGNVGIGEPNPSAKLHVTGDIRARKNSGDAFVEIRSESVGTASLVLQASANDTQKNPIIFLSNTDFGAGDGFTMEWEHSADKFHISDIGGARRLTIDTDGKVGIGTVDPQYKLHVNGSVAGVGAYNALSDLRYKKNLAAIPNAIDKITRLRGVSFDWRQEEFPEFNFSKGRNLGFIAQEIKEVLPEVVSQDSKGYYSVAYSNVVPVLVEAIKEQQNTIAQLQAQVQTLQRTQDELESLKERMRRLEALLADAKTEQSSMKLTGH